MSKFYDFWFGTKDAEKPKFVRKDNSDWSRSSFGGSTYWQSVPISTETSEFVSTTENDSYRLILLGQLYETLSIAELLNRCIKHIGGNQNFDDPAGHLHYFCCR